jgi:nitrogen-specific signal transduction histidine kinase
MQSGVQRRARVSPDRSPRHQASMPSSGLGLWIVSTFVSAHSGNAAIQFWHHGLHRAAVLPTTTGGA